MGRYYKLSRVISAETASQILEELQALDDVEKAYFEEGFTGVIIFTEDGEYTKVMDQAVNIFSREGSGTELQFDHFVFP